MFRRDFILKVLSFVTVPGFFQNLWSKHRAGAAALQKNFITIRKQGKELIDSKIPVLEKWNQVFVSLNAFSRTLDYGIYTNTSKRKAVLYVGRDKATFTADNGFVILNDQVYQFLHKPVWYHSELWLPLQLLQELFSTYTSHHMFYDEKNNAFVIGQKDVNITNLAISSKENGTLIKIFSEKTFSENDITLKISNGWLHVEIYGGKADADALARQKTAGVVSDIEVIQFDSLVSLAFRLRKSIIDKELLLSDGERDFMVSLRTKETIEQDQQTKEELERQKKEWLVDTIVIDPGHGGKDPGAVGHKNLYEKTIVLNVALQLGKVIKKKLPDVRVVYTRDKDVFIPLWKRTKIANEHKGKLFISIHCNSNRNKRVKGFETYFLSSDEDKNKQAQEVVLMENASIEFEAEEDRMRYEGINFILATMAQSAFIKQSQYLASSIQKSYAAKMKPLGMKDRGVKQGRFWVMVGATMPNVLIEMGYISNKQEANFLRKTSTNKKIAEAIFSGIDKYKKDVESSI
jgi:N-acetylmuramoyl-L-alanine amidase